MLKPGSEEPLDLGMGSLVDVEDLLDEALTSRRLQYAANSDHMTYVRSDAQIEWELPQSP